MACNDLSYLILAQFAELHPFQQRPCVCVGVCV
jgi:hypothetical protein